MGKVNLADKLGSTRARVDQQRHGAENALVPKFQRLTRKETRVREDQYASLSAVARRLMRTRRVRTERITENTLIRVAIDLLLIHESELRGSNETELRKSVTSELRKSDTDELPKPVTPAATDSETPRSPHFRSASPPEIRTSELDATSGGLSL